MKKCRNCFYWTKQDCRHMGTCDAGHEWRNREPDDTCSRWQAKPLEPDPLPRRPGAMASDHPDTWDARRKAKPLPSARPIPEAPHRSPPAAPDR